jgi:predicted component of type VI protein secretion system
MPAQLIALTDGPNILLDKPVLLLGRHPECDIQIDSRKISRRHCCIAQVDDYLVVRDLGSTNGIRINNVRVQEGRLRPDDELTIGNSRYKVRWDTLAEALAPPIREAAPARAARVDVLDDDALESCEEPVPLDEPNSPLPIAARAVQSAERKPEPEPLESIILPDNLELAPLSDIVPPRSPG